MPGPKARTPAPIDKPLSRAYLREFTGWSSAYPPGISDPTSLRIMENVMINRDGSARVRPGLRYVSYQDVAGVLAAITNQLVGTHEPFFLNDGTKAYLFAVLEDDGSVGFRVLADSPLGMVARQLEDDGIEFDIHGEEGSLNFTGDTTYVKYLQIDNKIYALSNAGETMRQFTVGKQKTAKKLSAIDRPEWTVDDKLAVVHPDAGWINSGAPTSTIYNRFTSPDMEDVTNWHESGRTNRLRTTSLAERGIYGMKITSTAERTNLVTNPLENPSTHGHGGWSHPPDYVTFDDFATGLRVNIPSGHGGDLVHGARSPQIQVQAGEKYRAAFTLETVSSIDGLWTRFVFYTTSGKQIGEPIDRFTSTTAGDRKFPVAVTAPKGADTLHVGVVGRPTAGGGAASYRIRDVVVCESTEEATAFSGDSGANYFWTGAAHDSVSVYHPPATVQVYTDVTGLSATSWRSSIYFRAGSTARNVSIDLEWRKSDNTVIDTEDGSSTADDDASWTKIWTSGSAPAKTTKARVRVKIASVPRGEAHYMDTALFVKTSQPDDYFDGSTGGTDLLRYDWTGKAHSSMSTRKEYSVVSSLPPAESKTADTLVSSSTSANKHNFGFFYTFSNEVGESSPSRVSVVRAQRSWAGWQWETPNASGEPSGTTVADPDLAADQLAAYMPQPVFEEAIDSGATHWNLYMLNWSDQDPVPVMAVRVDQQEIFSGAIHAKRGWMRVTPDMNSHGAETAPVPTGAARFNYSDPGSPSQGIVAADRMILVNDPNAAAVIRWTSNEQGYYTDFSASRGGGYKTLTSGNLYIPATVKLWQNPQSADTLTILCMGVDGYSAGYYMAPAQVAQQSEAVNIMGFEETTATPGTVAPHGCEVMNNALYHPLDEQLMKSTATNYNINHKSMTDQIANSWQGLQDKQLIVSSQHDNRIYYLVHNAEGEPLPEGCRGNEVWVFDAASEGGSWSRWLVPGHSLRKLEQGGSVAMSLVHPTGIFYFDDAYDRDDYVDELTGLIAQRYIPWFLETNTQGANRAHDANAHLQQANIVLGNFQGQMRYGIRAWDLHGKRVDISKIVRDNNEPSSLQWDLEDYLLIRRDVREWFFYAGSVSDELGVVQKGVGQVNLVQYRYTPSTVNTGYEFGSVQTFEYGRAAQPIDNRTTDNGVPMPYVDTARP